MTSILNQRIGADIADLSFAIQLLPSISYLNETYPIILRYFPSNSQYVHERFIGFVYKKSLIVSMQTLLNEICLNLNNCCCLIYPNDVRAFSNSSTQFRGLCDYLRSINDRIQMLPLMDEWPCDATISMLKVYSILFIKIIFSCRMNDHFASFLQLSAHLLHFLPQMNHIVNYYCKTNHELHIRNQKVDTHRMTYVNCWQNVFRSYKKR